MTRRSYKSFPYNDFGGWLNLRDSANQIEDKQSTVCENFSFEWNRLVTSKKIKEKWNLSLSWEIRAIFKSWDDVFFTHESKVYKNWVELPITVWTLPNKRGYISVWWDLVFFTFDDGTESPYYLNGTTLTEVVGLGNPKYNIVYNGKWVLGGYGNDNIYFSKTAWPTTKSDIYDFSAYSAGNQSVGWDAQGAVTGFKIGENGLYVFKKDAVHYSNTENDTGTTFQFIFNKITSNWAINQNAIEEVNQEIFYFDWVSNRARRLGYEKDSTTLRDTAISDEIEPIFAMLSDDLSSTSISYSYPNLKFFLRGRTAWVGINDVCLSYNVDVKSWAVETKKTCSVAKGGYLGSVYDWIVYEDDKNPATEGVRISKEFDLWAPVDYKRIGELEVKGKMDSTLTAFFDIYVDWVVKETRTVTVEPNISQTLGTNVLGASVLSAPTTLSDTTEFRERVDMFYEWRYIKIGVRYEGIGYLEIDHYKIEAKPLKGHSIFM